MAPRVPRDVDEYLARVPPAERALLERVRKRIHAIAPDASETISYGYPTFVVEGRAVVWIAAFKKHCSLFPGSIHFTPDEPLSPTLLRRIVRARIAENRAFVAERAVRKAAKKAARRPRRPRKPASAGSARRDK